MSPGQSRRMSLLEAIANTVVGYAVALATQLVVFPVVGLQVTLAQNLLVGGMFSAVSIARGFVLRRLFEGWRTRRGTAAPAGRRP